MTISVAQAQLFFLAFVRIMAIMVHVPVLGGQNIPNQVRIGLGFVLAMVLIPWQPLPSDAATIGTVAYMLAIGKEIVIGTLVGFSADLAFGAIQVAGSAMGLGSGFESSRIFNPNLGDAGSSFDQLFIMTATMIFLVIDGHHVVLIAIQKTFEALPLNGSLPFGGLQALMTATSVAVAAGVHLAMPVIAALILADLTLGLLARVAPQIQVYFLGLPAKVAVSLMALGLVFTVASPAVRSIFETMAGDMLHFIEK